MATIKEYLDYAELAQAAYGNLEIGVPDTKKLNEGNAEFTTTQATNFADRYVVEAVYNDTNSGFSATLFKDKNGKKILSIRGTEKSDRNDFYADWELVLKQNPQQFESLVNFFEELKSSGKISKSDNLTVVGHSLGGALAQIATATYKDYIDQTYTYNSPGAKNLSIPNVMEYQGEYYRNYEVLSGGVVTGEKISKELYDAYQNFNTNKNSQEVANKITNIKANSGNDVISDLGVDIGVNVNIPGYTHSIIKMIETLQASVDAGVLTLDELQEFTYKCNSLTTQDRYNLAQMITAGGMPWNYVPSMARSYDPLVLDLNHDGVINTKNITNSNAYFDMDRDDMSESTGWISKEDGILVYDKNGNGKIDDINEFFGNEAKDGYSDLKQQINSNRDNVINANDTLFSKLKVWQDTNGDGISQADELKTLDELNVTSISLNSTDTSVDSNGNTIIKTSTFTQNSQEYLSADVEFAINNMMTDYHQDYNLDADTLFLPWLRGYGNVKDARIAYSLDGNFKEFTKTLTTNKDNLYSKFDNFLKKWTGLDKIHEQYGVTRGALNVDDKVWMLETFAGENIYKTSIENAFANHTVCLTDSNSDYIESSFNDMKERNFALFMAQSYYKKAFEGSYYSVNQDRFIVTDQELLNSSIVNFLNTHNIEDAVNIANIFNKTNQDFNISKELITQLSHINPNSF
ncbi:MAG: DUF2974 domain-containing protein [Campylobacteraceae bacterium]|nr:DUF2974 domain-containing protein [Campylobacteraceae bacterium]